MNLLHLFATTTAYAVIACFFMWVAKKLADSRVADGFDANYEIEEQGNLALALRRAGFYVGVAVGMLGALSGSSIGFVSDVKELALDGALVTAFLFVALYLNNWVIVHGIDNDGAIRQKNVAVGLTELGSYVATGLIAYGAFSGQGGGVVSAIVFFTLGQAALLVFVVLYEAITPFRVIEEVRANNASAGLMLAGMVIALGWIIKASIVGDFHGWSQDLSTFGVSVVIGIILLLLFTVPVDKLFLPGTTIRTEIERDQNVAAIAVTVGVKVSVALVIGAVVV